MLESVVMMLIYLCLLAIAVYLIIWVLGIIGVVIPDPIMKLLWVIVVLLAVLMIVRVMLPGMGLRMGGLISYLV